MDWFNQLIQRYGIFIALLLVFFYKEGWPWVRDRWYPASVKAASDERRHSRRREDHVIKVITENTAAMMALTVAIGSQQRTQELINQQIIAQSTILTVILENIAGLYGAAGLDRPSYSSLAPKTSPVVRAQQEAGA